MLRKGNQFESEIKDKKRFFENSEKNFLEKIWLD